MKQFYLLITLFLITLNSIEAQVVDLVTNSNSIRATAFHAESEVLYISMRDEGKIYKINPFTHGGVLEEVVDADVFSPSFLKFKGDVLYFSDGNQLKRVFPGGVNPPVTTLLSVNGLTGMAIKDNYIYISEYFENKIIKVDLNDPTFTKIDVVVGLNLPSNPEFIGDDLYIIDDNGISIKKIDTSVANPTVTSVYTGSQINSLTSDGETLYIGEYTKLLKLETTDPMAVVEHIMDISVLIGVEFYNNSIFMARWEMLSKLDLRALEENEITTTSLEAGEPTDYTFTQITGFNVPGFSFFDIYPVTGSVNYPVFQGNIPPSAVPEIDVFFNDSPVEETVGYLRWLGDRIRYDYEDPIPVGTKIKVIIKGIVNPSAAENLEAKIELSTNTSIVTTYAKLFTINDNTLGIEAFENINQIKLFPNPATNVIGVSGLKVKQNYRIYNVLGKEVLKGGISNNEKIEINSLVNGLYLLQFEDGDTMKFVKK